MTKASLAGARVAAWRKDILRFVRENFNAEPDLWQRAALLAFANDTDPRMRRIAMKACAGPGKSTVMAWCAWWFLTCCADKGRHPNGYATSITGDNLQDCLWKELAKWQAVSPFLGAAFLQTTEKIVAVDHPKTWWLKARSWPKSADQETIGRTLSGLHAPYIAYFIDESGDIPTSMLRTAEQGLTNCEWGKIMTGGNTTSQQGLLYEAAVRQAHLFTVISITADPDDPNRTPRVDPEWAREQIRLYGRENPWVMAYILGLFPLAAFNTLLSSDDVEAAMQRSVPDSAYSNVQKRLGIDVARFGDDSTSIFPRQGLRAFMPVPMRNARTTEIAARVMVAKEKWGSEMELIDDTGGWAAGVIDQCLLRNLTLVPVNFSGKASDPRFYNLRSEILWKTAEWVKNGGQLPNYPPLIRQGSSMTYYMHDGKLRVEEKDQIKKRIGQSPDDWDALATTFAVPDQPAALDALLAAVGAGTTDDHGWTPTHAATEWDPYS